MIILLRRRRVHFGHSQTLNKSQLSAEWRKLASTRPLPVLCPSFGTHFRTYATEDEKPMDAMSQTIFIVPHKIHRSRTNEPNSDDWRARRLIARLCLVKCSIWLAFSHGARCEQSHNSQHIPSNVFFPSPKRRRTRRLCAATGTLESLAGSGETLQKRNTKTGEQQKTVRGKTSQRYNQNK